MCSHTSPCRSLNDGNASWYSVCRVLMVAWLLDCENCHHLTVICLHDTSPRFIYLYPIHTDQYFFSLSCMHWPWITGMSYHISLTVTNIRCVLQERSAWLAGSPGVLFTVKTAMCGSVRRPCWASTWASCWNCWTSLHCCGHWTHMPCGTPALPLSICCGGCELARNFLFLLWYEPWSFSMILLMPLSICCGGCELARNFLFLLWYEPWSFSMILLMPLSICCGGCELARNFLFLLWYEPWSFSMILLIYSCPYQSAVVDVNWPEAFSSFVVLAMKFQYDITHAPINLLWWMWVGQKLSLPLWYEPWSFSMILLMPLSICCGGCELARSFLFLCGISHEVSVWYYSCPYQSAVVDVSWPEALSSFVVLVMKFQYNISHSFQSLVMHWAVVLQTSLFCDSYQDSSQPFLLRGPRVPILQFWRGLGPPESIFERVPTPSLFLHVCGFCVATAVDIKFSCTFCKRHPGQIL